MNIPAYVIWLAAAILFGILEAVMLGLNSIWFSVGALAAMAAALLGGGVWLQAVVFLAVSLAALLAAKKLLKSRFNRAANPPMPTGSWARPSSSQRRSTTKNPPDRSGRAASSGRPAALMAL